VLPRYFGYMISLWVRYPTRLEEYKGEE